MLLDNITQNQHRIIGSLPSAIKLHIYRTFHSPPKGKKCNNTCDFFPLESDHFPGHRHDKNKEIPPFVTHFFILGVSSGVRVTVGTTSGKTTMVQALDLMLLFSKTQF